MTMARNNIRYFRKKKGLTQKKLAELSGVSFCTITNLERSGAQPSERVREFLSEALGVDEETLCGFDSPFTSCSVSLPKADGDYLCAYKVHPRSPYEYQVLRYSEKLKAWSTNYSIAPINGNSVKWWMDIPDLPSLE